MSSQTAASADRVLLITGASSGIGAANRSARQRRWMARGARSSFARSPGRAGRGARRARTCIAVGCDVAEWAEQQQMVETTLAAFGRIDVVFANAGFGGPRGFLETRPSTGARWC